MEDYAEKMQRCNEYIEALEEERRKIQVFQRELPLCLELVTQAIEGCRQQLPCAETTDYFNGQHQRQQQSDFSEQTSSDGPVLEQFIPIKRCSSVDVDDDDCGDEEEESHKPNTEKSGKKSDWLRSVQLWNQTPDLPLKEDSPKKESVTEVKKNGGAFRHFNKKKDLAISPEQKGKSPPAVATAAASSSAGTDSGGSGGNRREDKQGAESQRKQRRCWSPELHRRFINALQQLGGAHVATPKQIREFMKVDGLTNDEVKSHLQKYRLHTRRPSSGMHNNGNPQAPQFVVVGGIWVQPSEYAKIGAAASGQATGVTTVNEIYAPAPIAALPPSSSVTQGQQQQQQQHKQKQSKHSHSEEGGRHFTSPATSNSSTHTTTASLVF